MATPSPQPELLQLYEEEPGGARPDRPSEGWGGGADARSWNCQVSGLRFWLPGIGG